MLLTRDNLMKINAIAYLGGIGVQNATLLAGYIGQDRLVSRTL